MKGANYFRLTYLPRHVLIKLTVVVVVVVGVVFYVPTVRNVFLKSYLPRAWWKLSSMDVIKMRKSPPIPVTDLDLSTCARMLSPNVSVQDATLTSHFGASTAEVELRAESHRSFLPIVTDAEKRGTLYLYAVVAKALRRAGVEHFIAEGSLLGVVRHGGFVPWDDDIDIAISATDWPSVRTALSCIDGFQLNTAPKMHWKFHARGHKFPFVDLFFYAHDGVHLWAMTDYIATTLVYRLGDVFPLKAAAFESLQVPVPCKAETVVNDVFEKGVCKSPSSQHKNGIRMQVVALNCTALDYLYTRGKG